RRGFQLLILAEGLTFKSFPILRTRLSWRACAPRSKLSFYSTSRKPSCWISWTTLVKAKILWFVCAVKNIERTFNTYYELQEHLYRDHDMKKDPAMDIFNKYKPAVAKTPTAEQ